MLGQVKAAAPATFQELFELSDANFDCLIGKTPLIIVGPLTEQSEDKRCFPWIMSWDGKPLFGTFDHSFDIAPGHTREEVFLGMIDHLLKVMGREGIEVKVAKTHKELANMVTALWPHTNLEQLTHDWVEASRHQFNKMIAAREAFDATIDADVKKFGHMIIMTETEERVPMSYTVGLAEAGLPEMVCFGLQPKDMTLLNDAAELLRKG